MQPVLPAGSCPFRSESDLHPALPRNGVMRQKATLLDLQPVHRDPNFLKPRRGQYSDYVFPRSHNQQKVVARAIRAEKANYNSDRDVLALPSPLQ